MNFTLFKKAVLLLFIVFGFALLSKGLFDQTRQNDQSSTALMLSEVSREFWMQKIALNNQILENKDALFALNSIKEIEPKRKYLNNLEIDQEIPIFSEAGLTPESCLELTEDDCKKRVGFVNRNSEIYAIGEEIWIKYVEEDESSDYYEEFIEPYTAIYFQYEKTNQANQKIIYSGIGFISSYQLYDTKLDPFFKKLKAEKRSPNQIITSLFNKVETSFYDSYKDIIGFCPLTEPWKKRALKTKNAYDDFVLNRMPISKYIKDANKLTTVDALARTLYGEMGVCFKYGLQYPLAVARIIYNRSTNVSAFASYTSSVNHHVHKSSMAKVSTTPSQFSMWLNKNQTVKNKNSISQKVNKTMKIKRKIFKNGPLYQGLCPPAHVGAAFYKSDQAKYNDYLIWSQALQIAFSVVEDTQKFLNLTADLKNVEHYTSNLRSWRKNTSPNRPNGTKFIDQMELQNDLISIGGRRLENLTCLEAWK